MQTLADYGFGIPPAVAGMLYDITENTVDSMTAIETIPFGAPVAMTTAETCEVYDSVSKKFAGVALRTHARADHLSDGYIAKERVSVMRDGRAWVVAAVAVTKGTPAFVTAAGLFTNVEGSNVLVGEWMTTTGSTNQLAVLEVTKGLQAVQTTLSA